MKRRAFLKQIGITTAYGAILSSGVLSNANSASAISTASKNAREEKMKAVRDRALKTSIRKGFPKQTPNLDYTDNPLLFGYSKGLSHNKFGEVQKKSYDGLQKAINSQKSSDFEKIELAGPKKLKNPLAGLSFNLEGPDPSQFKMPAPPTVSSNICGSEMRELYWMALCRDITFSSYNSDALTIAASSELSSSGEFGAPRDNEKITPDFLFRANNNNHLLGPYISQFLYIDCPIGTLTLSPKQKTVQAGINYLTEEELWLRAQNGFSSFTESLDSTPRYIRNGRDLARFVHIDRLIPQFVNAAFIMQFVLETKKDSGNPYTSSKTMDGFSTFDYPHLQGLLGEVCYRALHAVWFQKWFVHSRLRPEELAGRIHMMKSGKASYRINELMLSGDFMDRIKILNGGSYFLPMSYPEGSPLHPAYGSGHAVAAGALATILKAWFNDGGQFDNPVEASEDGLSLRAYTGSDAGSLTIGGEIDKLAFNTGFGRCWAGVHYRSDITEALLLGEEVAIAFLNEIKLTLPERFNISFKNFAGKKIRIKA